MESPEEVTKITLDENRMLVLVVQVLLGFFFQGAFQPGFERLSGLARLGDFLAGALLVACLGLLLMIPAEHRIAEGGRQGPVLYRFANRTMTLALMPFLAAMALGPLVVLENTLGRTGAILFAGAVLAMGALFWFGLPLLRRTAHPSTPVAMPEKTPPLKDRVNQVLTECRVVIPGTQALLGFQLIAFLMDAFAELPREFQGLHTAALACVLIAVLLLMLPAAFHRIAEEGRETEALLRVSNLALTVAMPVLAAGLALDFWVVVFKFSVNRPASALAALAVFLFLTAAWTVLPLVRRARRMREP